MSTLVLAPSRQRPASAAELVRSFAETRRERGSRLVFLVDADDPTLAEYPHGATQPVTGGSLGNALREVAKDKTLLGDATSVGVVGDDVRFRTPGWDLMLDAWLTANVGIAWGNDGWAHKWPNEQKAAHWWLSRPIVDAMGLCPPTRHWFMDDYWAALGWATGTARYFPDVLMEHLHHLPGKANRDATYERSETFVREDKYWWQNWQARGKAADVKKLRAIARPDGRLRVFADWHHPALWEALSIVFEDRFGWSLFSPVGSSWTEHGWMLQNGTPGWCARDYLVPRDVTHEGDHWTTVEPEYPARPRKMVTWDQFESQPWDIIIASVGVHQQPFSKLAQEKGARYVHHIGDARRRLDRSIRHATIMASARWSGAHITHHQEFDRTLFAPSPVTDPHAVTSLMLRLSSTSGPYEWLAQAPGVRWSAVECDAMRDPGYVVPMAAVAERIRNAGWVWHDKAGYRGATPGDGYGHVLFTAAAMGRPLIGHASHYRGQMGERLWEDGVTCLSLDDKTTDQALREWRDISGDPDRHAAMSEAIRQRFDELVDFDAEAEKIRRVLET